MIDFCHSFCRDVRIDLGCGNISMPQQLLHNPQIRSVFKNMRRKGMAQHMRRYIFFDAGIPHGLLQVFPDPLAGEAIAMEIQEQEGSLFPPVRQSRTTVRQVFRNPEGGFLSQRHDSFFIAFPDRLDKPDIQMDFAHRDVDEFADAKTGGIQ